MDAGMLLQRLAVRDALERYFSCIDRRDWTGLGDCFALDAVATYGSGGAATVSGRAAIVDRLHVIERFAATNHILSNARISVQGARALTCTQAVAQLVMGEAGAQRVLVRGLRYDDTLSLSGGTWRIERRVHQPLWQYQADAIPPGF